MRVLLEPRTSAATAAREPLEHVPQETYDRLTAGSFFASRGFLDLWRFRGGRPVVWTVRLDGAIAGLVPGVEFGHGPLSRFASLPDGCYGGLFVDPGVADAAPILALSVMDAIDGYGYGRVHVFDARRSLAGDHAFERRMCETTHIELRESWPEDAALRREIRKAERAGVEVVPYDSDRDRDGLLRLAAHTYQRHGVAARYSPSFFDGLATLARRDPRIRWVWCEHGGEPVCSHIFFIEGEAMQLWQLYFDKRFSFLNPNAYIRHRMGCEAMAAGLRIMNLGSTPAGAEGVTRNKSRWGGREVLYHSLVRTTGAVALLARVRAAVLPPQARWIPAIPAEPMRGRAGA